MAITRHVPATTEHALYLATHMRAEDRREVWCSDRQMPFTALVMSMQSSEIAMTTLINGQVAAIWGVIASPEPGAFIVWMLSSTVVDRYPVAFWRACKSELARLLRHYHVLCNFIDSSHIRAVCWARRLGFTVFPSEPYGPGGEPFHFVIMRESYADRHGESAQKCGWKARQGAKAQKEKGRNDQGGARPVCVRDVAKERLEATP